MSTLNASPATQANGKALWMRALAALGMAGAGALAVVLALAFLPPHSTFVSRLLSPALPSAMAAESGSRPAPADLRRHRHADALTAQHGTYVRDPYGCLYMFQYLEAKLSLMPVRDEGGQRVCARQQAN